MGVNLFKAGEWYFFSDRYVYLSSLFIIAPVVFYLSRYRWKHAVYLIIVLFSALTSVQLQTWRNTETLFANVVRYYESSIAYHKLGVALKERGDRAGAEGMFRRAAEIIPNASSYYMLGQMSVERDDLRTALEYFEKAAASENRMKNPQDLFQNLGAIYLIVGDYSRARMYLERALTLDPGNEDILYNLELLNERTLPSPTSSKL
jgi:tetratricopeptide (TPR) repeat protein